MTSQLDPVDRAGNGPVILSRCCGVRVGRFVPRSFNFWWGVRAEKYGPCAKSAQIGTGFASTVAKEDTLDRKENANMSRGTAFRRLTCVTKYGKGCCCLTGQRRS